MRHYPFGKMRFLHPDGSTRDYPARKEDWKRAERERRDRSVNFLKRPPGPSPAFLALTAGTLLAPK